MTYQYTTLAVLLLIAACVGGKNDQITASSIKVIPLNQQAYVNEHCRKVLVQNKKGHIVDEENLFCDPAASCNSFLFDTDDSFTLIDCNGQWYTISKSTGDLEKIGIQWQKELPGGYIGTYKAEAGAKSYSLIVEDDVTAEKIYTRNPSKE